MVDGTLLSFRFRENLHIRAMKRPFIFSKALELESHHQMQFSVKSREVLFDRRDVFYSHSQLDSEKELEKPIKSIKIYNQNIGKEFVIRKSAVLVIKKRGKSGRNRIIKSVKHQNTWRKRKWQEYENIWCRHLQVEIKKKSKSSSEEPESFSKSNCATKTTSKE